MQQVAERQERVLAGEEDEVGGRDFEREAAGAGFSGFRRTRVRVQDDLGAGDHGECARLSE